MIEFSSKILKYYSCPLGASTTLSLTALSMIQATCLLPQNKENPIHDPFLPDVRSYEIDDTNFLSRDGRFTCVLVSDLPVSKSIKGFTFFLSTRKFLFVYVEKEQ